MEKTEKKILDKLVSSVAKREGKKCQVSAGNIREVLAIVADVCHEDTGFLAFLILWGKRRKKGK